jgi:ABC-2 type transport system permease protein
MNKIWLVFKQEYLRHVLRKRFIFAILSVPFFVLIATGIGILASSLAYNGKPIGYVDQSGWLAHPVMAEKPTGGLFSDVEIRPFSDEAAARASLDKGIIQAYYVLPADYLTTQQVRLVGKDNSASDNNSQFRQFLRLNITSKLPEETAHRLQAGSQIQIETLDHTQNFTGNNWLSIIMPILTALLFVIAITISGGYLLQAVVEEKENRTMEIIITSISPNQLMAGKILGNLSVGLTQLLIWISFPILGLLIAQQVIPAMPELQINPAFFWLLPLTFLPSFVMIAALMAAMGATVTERSEGQQIAGLFTLPIFIPIWFVGSIMENPNSTIAVILSFIPFTAPVTLPLRAAFTVVPVWQIILVVILLNACAVGAIWLAGKAFRVGMLQYGKRLSFKQIFQRS